MEPLDDLAYLERLDAGRMRERIEEFPAQCRAAWENAAAFPWPRLPRELQNVVIAGMGGSAIGGELLAALAARDCPVPILVHRDYGLPACIGAQSLVIASSYSGNTEETLSATREALGRRATVVGLARGGALEALAREAGFPLFTIRYQAMPRAALAHSFVPLVYFLQHSGLLSTQSAALEEGIAIMEAMGSAIGVQVPAQTNLAKQLAHAGYGRLCFVYGAEFLGAVAHRWKTQLNENSKAWAGYEALPEMNHNAVAGYDQPVELAGQSFVVLLQSRLTAPQNRERMAVTAEVLGRAGVRHHTVEVEGSTVLAQMLSGIHLGDYVSLYLAALYGVDPTPIPAIELLKARLSEVGAGR